MTAKLTKDEFYLCTLCRAVKRETDLTVSRYEVGKLANQNNKSVDNTVQILVKTNFVKRAAGDDISITLQGIALVDMLEP